MAYVSIQEAGSLTGKSIKTLYRHIDNGKLTATLDENGIKVVDTSELIRVYGELNPIDGSNEKSQSKEMSCNENENISDILNEKIKYLESVIKMKDEIIESKEELIENKNIVIEKLEKINLLLEEPTKSKKSKWKFWGN
ncbi:hypothetical protein GKC56_05465 [Neisseriaceae bacterium PsAf]|nr:hypothetical protein [Neisseriaceae bacterium PsAf]